MNNIITALRINIFFLSILYLELSGIKKKKRWKNDAECKLIIDLRNNESDKVIVKMRNKIRRCKMLRETLMRIFFFFFFFLNSDLYNALTDIQYYFPYIGIHCD